MQSILSLLVTIRNLLAYKWYNFLALLRISNIPVNSVADFVVSIASYPKRDYLLPAVYETLARQIVKPKKFILVLAKEEYPNQLLPHHLQKLVNRGVEIIWSERNPYAVKKLVPVLQKYPQLDIITFDDENLYGRHVVEKLINARNSNLGCIIGHYGKVLYKKGGYLNMMYRLPGKANKQTPSIRVFLIGNAGILYPTNTLNLKVLDLKAITEIVPGRGSDIWFWAAAVANGTKQICLGTANDRKLFIPIPENKQTIPKDTPGGDVMEQRFQAAINFFAIRETLLNQLPEKSR
jgi:hypothetical protein